MKLAQFFPKWCKGNKVILCSLYTINQIHKSFYGKQWALRTSSVDLKLRRISQMSLRWFYDTWSKCQFIPTSLLKLRILFYPLQYFYTQYSLPADHSVTWLNKPPNYLFIYLQIRESASWNDTGLVSRSSRDRRIFKTTNNAMIDTRGFPFMFFIHFFLRIVGTIVERNNQYLMFWKTAGSDHLLWD